MKFPVEVIEKPELQILMNVLGEMEVGFPLYDIPLLRAKPTEKGYRVEVVAGKREFDENVPGGGLSHELPTWSDLYECFISSGGILRYGNIDEFLQNLELYERLRKGVVFAPPDTNVLYHRFISSFRPLDGYRIVVAEGVKKEIENAMNYKYRRRELEEMRRGGSRTGTS